MILQVTRGRRRWALGRGKNLLQDEILPIYERTVLFFFKKILKLIFIRVILIIKIKEIISIRLS